VTAEKNVDKVVQELLSDENGLQNGVLVEVGAAHPDYLSISSSFRHQGWKIVSIEPNPEFCKLHRDLGYTVHQYACSDTESDAQDFYVVDSKGTTYLDGSVSFESFSSLGIEGDYLDLHQTVKDKTNIKKIEVKVRKLDTILQEHEPDVERVDVIAVDVEGWELSVMRGFSTERYKPRVVILENLFLKKEYEDYMVGIGYKLWKRLEPNDIYLDHDTYDLAMSKSTLLERVKRLFL
jgi:FkbM family methyltransferase